MSGNLRNSNPLQVSAIDAFIASGNPTPSRNTRAGREMYCAPITCPENAEVTITHNLGRRIVGMEVTQNGTMILPQLTKTATISTTAKQSIMPNSALLNAIVRFW